MEENAPQPSVIEAEEFYCCYLGPNQEECTEPPLWEIHFLAEGVADFTMACVSHVGTVLEPDTENRVVPLNKAQLRPAVSAQPVPVEIGS